MLWIVSKSTEVDRSVDYGPELSVFSEHRSHRDRLIVSWPLQENACREIQSCPLIWGSCTLGICFSETT